jgi:hypothetical protein
LHSTCLRRGGGHCKVGLLQLGLYSWTTICCTLTKTHELRHIRAFILSVQWDFIQALVAVMLIAAASPIREHGPQASSRPTTTMTSAIRFPRSSHFFAQYGLIVTAYEFAHSATSWSTSTTSTTAIYEPASSPTIFIIRIERHQAKSAHQHHKSTSRSKRRNKLMS